MAGDQDQLRLWVGCRLAVLYGSVPWKKKALTWFGPGSVWTMQQMFLFMSSRSNCEQDWESISGNFMTSVNFVLRSQPEGEKKKKRAFRLTRTSQWLELKRAHVFSTGQLPNLRAQRAKRKHLSNRKKKISEQLCFELLDVEAASKCLSLEYWKPLSAPSESPSAATQKPPKGIGQTDPSINFSV